MSSPTASLSKLLESRILRWIGTRSDSIYLWHWPIFILTRPRIDIHLPALLVRAAQLLVTFGLAELSYRWIESPIRHQGFRSGLRSWRAAFRSWSIPQKVGVGTGILCAGLLLRWQTYLPVSEVSPDRLPARQNTLLPANIGHPTLTKPAFPNTQQAVGASTSVQLHTLVKSGSSKTRLT
jgi:hypothetical protein